LATANAVDGHIDAAGKKALLAELNKALKTAAPAEQGKIEGAIAAVKAVKPLTAAQAKKLGVAATPELQPAAAKAAGIIKTILTPGGYHGPKQSAITALTKEEFDSLPLSQRAAIGNYIAQGVSGAVSEDASSVKNAIHLFGSKTVPPELIGYQKLTEVAFPYGTTGNLANSSTIVDLAGQHLTPALFKQADPGMRDLIRDSLAKEKASAVPNRVLAAAAVAKKLGITIPDGKPPAGKDYSGSILNQLSSPALANLNDDGFFKPTLPNPTPGGQPGAKYVAKAAAPTNYTGSGSYTHEPDNFESLSGGYVTSLPDLLALRAKTQSHQAGPSVHVPLKGIESLTGSAHSAANGYTGSSYTPMNDAMRTFSQTGKWDDSSYGTQAKHLYDVFKGDKAGRLAEDTILFRGFREGDKVLGDAWGPDLAGVEFTNQAFSSTSTSYGVGERFAGEGFSPNGVVMRLHVKKGTQGISAQKGGSIQSEQEVILGPGTRYRIVADYGWRKGMRMVDVEVVNGGPGSLAAAAARIHGVRYVSW
jgi:hypothetical protein